MKGRVIMLIINDSICRGGSSWDAHRFNSHESRLYIQVPSSLQYYIHFVHSLKCRDSKMYSWSRLLTFNPAARLNQPSSHFTLSPTSGELRTSSRLDREGRDGSDSVDLVALSSSPTYPIEASCLLISILFPHVSKQMEGGLADHVGERWCHGYEWGDGSAMRQH